MPEPVHILPRDPHNEALVANVHPADWVNPTPAGRYNLVLIGAGYGWPDHLAGGVDGNNAENLNGDVH